MNHVSYACLHPPSHWPGGRGPLNLKCSETTPPSCVTIMRSIHEVVVLCNRRSTREGVGRHGHGPPLTAPNPGQPSRSHWLGGRGPLNLQCSETTPPSCVTIMRPIHEVVVLCNRRSTWEGVGRHGHGPPLTAPNPGQPSRSHWLGGRGPLNLQCSETTPPSCVTIMRPIHEVVVLCNRRST